MEKNTKNFCPRCGYLNIEMLSTGEIICKNKHCLAISIIEKEKEVEND